MRWFIAASVASLAVVLIGRVGTWADEPVVVAAWEHRVTNQDGSVTKSTIKLYSNGHINDPGSKNTWKQEGNKLILLWPNPSAPGGAWKDTCTVSADSKTYTGRNQIGAAIEGKIVDKTAASAAGAAADDK